MSSTSHTAGQRGKRPRSPSLDPELVNHTDDPDRRPARRPRQTPTFGPLCHADPTIHGLSKTAALKEVQRLIREQVERLTNENPGKQPSHRKGHNETCPKLCLGGGENIANIGAWYQMCLTCNFLHWVTCPLKAIFLIGNGRLPTLLGMRHEIESFDLSAFRAELRDKSTSQLSQQSVMPRPRGSQLPTPPSTQQRSLETLQEPVATGSDAKAGPSGQSLDFDTLYT